MTSPALDKVARKHPRALVRVAASTALAAVLLVALGAFARVDVGDAWARTRAVNPWLLSLICLLGCAQAWLAAEKWRLVMAGGERPRALRTDAYAFTSLGVGLSLFAPPQIASALARAVGARYSREASLARGGAASLFEQLFDLAIVLAVGLAAVATFAFNGRDAMFWTMLAAALAVGWICAGLALEFARALLSRFAERLQPAGRLARLTTLALDSGFASGALARRLFLLSALRFAALVAFTAVVREVAEFDFPLWYLVAGLPLAVLASTLAPTPSGLGVTEWAFAAAMTALGAPFEAAVQLAIVNRLLATVVMIFVGLSGAVSAAWSQAASRAAAPATGVSS